MDVVNTDLHVSTTSCSSQCDSYDLIDTASVESSPLVDTPSPGESFDIFKDMDSLVVQYKRKLDIDCTQDESNFQAPVSEKRRLEFDTEADIHSGPLSVVEECTKSLSEAELSVAGIAVSDGCFGKGVKSKMKERRKKQQLILNEYRPQWNHVFSSTNSSTSELGKRVRFDVSKNEDI